MDQGTLKSLRSRLAALRLRLRLAVLSDGTTRLLQLAVAAVILTFLMDWFLDLPRWVRAFHASLIVVVVILTINRFVVAPLLRTLSDEELAILIERKNPGFRTRLISALQLARSVDSKDFTDSRPMVRALIQQTEQEVSTTPFAPIVDRRRILRAAGLMALGVATLIVFGTLYPQVTSIYIKRNLGLQEIDWPQKTFLEVLLPNEGENIKISSVRGMTVLRIAKGSDFKINVKVNGHVPSKVELFYEGIRSPDRETEVVRDRRTMNLIGNRDFTYQFLALTQSFYFHVEGGDDDDDEPRYWVDVQPTPRVESIQVDVTPPVYTRIEPQSFGHGNIEAPEGSLLRLRLLTDMDVDQAMMTITDGQPVKLTRLGPRTFLTTHVLTESLIYSFHLSATNGLKNRDPLRFTLTAVPDREPRIHLSLPGISDLDATPQAVVPIKLLISDDHGLEETWISFKLGRDLPEKVLSFPREDLVPVPQPDGRKEWMAFMLLDFSKLLIPASTDEPARHVDVGDRLRYLAIAKDGHADIDGNPAPNFGATPEGRISIVTRIELERRQEELRRRLRENIRKLQKKQIHLEQRVNDIVSAADDGGSESGLDRDRFDPREREAILDTEVGQNRLQSDGKRISVDLARIFDVHLFNRLEEGSLTEKVIATLFDSFRVPSADSLAGYHTVIDEYSRGALGDSDQIGKMIEMMRILFTAAFDHIPQAARELKEARSTVELDLRHEALRRAASAQMSVVDALELLLSKMEEWEDFQSIVQQARDLIESQRGVKNRTKNEIDRREKIR